MSFVFPQRSVGRQLGRKHSQPAHVPELRQRQLPRCSEQRVASVPRTHRGQHGFTLLELFAACIIISVVATLAIPAVTKQMRDRRTRLVAEELADQYRTARMRALGRGGAVMLRVTAGTTSTPATLELREAVRGGTNVNDAEAYMPVSSCTLTSWTLADLASTTGFTASRQIYRYAAPFEAAGATVAVIPRNQSNSELSSLSVCFTPMGRAFSSVDNGATWSPLSGVLSVRVYRTSDGTTPVGMERQVVLLPNGSARLAAVSPTP